MGESAVDSDGQVARGDPAPDDGVLMIVARMSALRPWFAEVVRVGDATDDGEDDRLRRRRGARLRPNPCHEGEDAENASGCRPVRWHTSRRREGAEANTRRRTGTRTQPNCNEPEMVAKYVMHLPNSSTR